MNKKIAGLGFPVFFFLPWLGFILSLFNLRSKVSAFIYIAFAMLLGYGISFTDTSVDSYRYAEAFTLFDTTLDYNKLVELYQNGEQRDIYRLLLFYFASIFTNNPKVMFAIAGLVYGILSYLALRVFVKEKGAASDRYILILSLVFYTFCSLSNINGFRFWTGAILLFYAAYNFIIEKKTIWVIGIILTPLIHYGFVLIVPLLIAYRYLHPLLYNDKGVRPILMYVFITAFIASWILSTNAINLGFLAQSSPLSGSVGSRIDYLNSDDIAEIVESRRDTSLFLNVRQYFDYAIKFYVFITVLFLNKLLLKGVKGNKESYANLLAFVLFFYSFAFIAASFPSGGRFLNIAHLFLVLLICKFYIIHRKKNIRRLIILALPVFAFNIAFTNGMLPIMLLTPTFWYGNVFWIIIEGLGFYL